MIKDFINLNSHSIFQFLALRLTLINIHNLNNNHTHQDFLEENKRFWLLHIIRDIKEFIFRSNKEMIAKQ